LCWIESHHKPQSTAFNDGKGGNNSHGLCQIQYDTAKFMGYTGSVKGLYDPFTNAKFAAKYLMHQLRSYNQDWRLAVAAYNAGTVIINKKGKVVNYKYVDQVEKAMAEGR
jgi:soluble lytic murein transglycosylase-like protein